MAEDFQHCNWWNNSRSGGFDGGSQSIASPSSSSLSCSATTTDVCGADFSWSSATEISESKPVSLSGNQIDSSLHISGLGFSTLSADWNQTLPGKAERSFRSMLHDQGLRTKPFSGQELGESSSTIPFKDMNSGSSSSPSYVYPSSSMLQTLIEPDSRFQQAFLDNQHLADYNSQMMAYHGLSNETQQPSWDKASQLFEGFTQKQQSANNLLQFTNNYTSLWNASAGFYPSPLPPSRTQLFDSESSCSVTAKSLGGDWEKRTTKEPGMKKTRIETHSPMPAFKVRKEKLGDRITALQQLVSPFGKTDTSSVLHEAIEYIKFLHDQVNVLCTPYFKNGRPMKQTQNSDKSFKSKEGELSRQGILRSRGLCLVPIASIYPVASGNSTTSDLWTPTYGRTDC